MVDRDFEPDPNPLCTGDPLARELARLLPAPVTMATTTLMYQAGRASRDSTIAFWQRLFAAACLSGVVGVILVGFYPTTTREPQVIERIVYRDPPTVPVELAPMPRERPDDSPPVTPSVARSKEFTEYLRIRDSVLTAGLDALPNPKPQPASTVTPAELERSLDLPRGVLTAPYRLPPKPPVPPDDE